MSKKLNLGIAISDLLIWIVVIGVVTSVALKFIPSYLEHRTALAVVGDLALAADVEDIDIQELKERLSKGLRINNLSNFQKQQRITFEVEGKSIVAKLQYEIRDQLVANIDYVISFDDEKVIRD